jgi:hypothetical protein
MFPFASNPTNVTFDPLWYPPQATPRIIGAVKVTVVCACANPATIKLIAKINFRIVLLLCYFFFQHHKSIPELALHPICGNDPARGEPAKPSRRFKSSLERSRLGAAV